MILEIDYGNTRLKWRFLDAGSLLSVGAGVAADLPGLFLLLKKTGFIEIKFCRVCSVRGNAENIKLTELVKDAYGIPVQYAKSEQTLAGVTSGYQCPAQLGVDRWLAIVAAYASIQGACIVIDCGTAITVDYISADGEHLGGFIAPGLKQMASMVENSTSLNVDLSRVESVEQFVLGDSTQAAVSVGIRMMLSGFVNEQLKLAKSKFGASYTVLCTGGDSRVVCSVISGAVIQEDLVFSGLAIACPYMIAR